MPYDLVAWDFDGTLADSFGGLVRIYNGLAVRHGFRPVEDPAAVRGLSLPALLRAHKIPLRKLPLLVRQVLAAQRHEAAGLRLFDGIADVLRALRQVGAGLVVLSSNAEANIRACLRANGVEELFAAVVGYRRLFGKGRALRRLVRGQGVDRRRVLYVGDEVRDIEAARQAGVDSAAVTWGFQTRPALAALGPTYLFDAPTQILSPWP
jgi:phosphoglycolate phosphatase